MELEEVVEVGLPTWTGLQRGLDVGGLMRLTRDAVESCKKKWAETSVPDVGWGSFALRWARVKEGGLEAEAVTTTPCAQGVVLVLELGVRRGSSANRSGARGAPRACAGRRMGRAGI